jgi:hypothetical protein
LTVGIGRAVAELLAYEATGWTPACPAHKWRLRSPT